MPVPIPMFVKGVVYNSDGTPASNVGVKVLNKEGVSLKDTNTGKPLLSVTGSDGKYALIIGFGGIQTGKELAYTFTRPPLRATTLRTPITGPNTDIKLPSRNEPKSNPSYKDEGGPKQPIADKKKEEESWIKRNKWVVIGGGVAVAGLIVTMIVLSKKNKASKQSK